MYRMIRSKAWLGVVPFAVLLLAAACSNGGNNNSNSSNNAQPAASVAATASGAPLSDCDYSKKILESFVPIQAAALQQETLGTPAPGGTAADANANLNKTLDAVSSGLNQAQAIMQKITPPADFKEFHASFITAIQVTGKQVSDAKTAFTAGDLSKAEALFSSAPDSFGSEFDKLQQQYPALTARIDACTTATP